MRALAEFVMRSRPHAMGATAVLAFLTLLAPPVGYLTGAVIALVVLRQGGREGGLTLLGGLLLAMVLSLLSGSSYLPVAMLTLFWLPVWVLAVLLESTRSLRIVFQVAALFGVVVVFLFYLMAEGNPSVWWQGLVQQMIAGEGGGDTTDPAAQILLDPRLADVLTGLMAAGFFLGLVVMVLIGRGWQAMLYNPGGLKEEFLALQLGKNSVLLGLVVMVPSMLMGDEVPSMVPDLMQIWMTLFMVQGLAVAHALVDQRGGQKGWVIALYMATLFTPLGFLVTMVGVTDAWINYRQQFSARGQ